VLAVRLALEAGEAFAVGSAWWCSQRPSGSAAARLNAGHVPDAEVDWPGCPAPAIRRSAGRPKSSWRPSPLPGHPGSCFTRSAVPAAGNRRHRPAAPRGMPTWSTCAARLPSWSSAAQRGTKPGSA